MPSAAAYGPVGRLGRYAATHVRGVAVVWALIAVGFGIFAPRVETALSGAGWEATGSESVAARQVIDHRLGGMSSSALMVVVQPGDAATVAPVLRADPRVAGVAARRSGSTVVVQAGAAADANTMVRAADDLKGPLAKLGGDGVRVSLTGASGMWSDFNVANRDAMMKSELLSWPVTLAILVLAFGSLVAAGLPLMRRARRCSSAA